MKRGDEHQLTVDNFAFEGKSLARVNGMVVFVAGGVPGDEVRVRITKVKQRFAEAETIGIVRHSPLRAVPRCPHFGQCGGCKWQHVGYQSQLEFKRQQVVDALERIGGFNGISVQPTIGAEEVYFYRNKMEFSFGDKWLTKDELEARQKTGRAWGDADRFALGLHIPRRFDKVLDLHECHLQSETSYRILNAVRLFCVERKLSIFSTVTQTGYLRNLVIRLSKRTNEMMVNVVTSDDRPEILRALTDLLVTEFPSITTVVNNITQRKSQVAIGDTEKVYYGPGFITERIGTRVYQISANSFFQTNTEQAERLYDSVSRMAHLKPSDVVFDLYSGTGTIAFHIADKVREVVGIEAVASAVEDARRNATVNKVGNCTFLLGDLKERLTKDTEWMQHRPAPTVVVIDPPRAGMHEKVISNVVGLRPDRVVYVSCNPATQARDLKTLCQGSSYKIVEVQPVDMFPHTYHIESVVGLSLTS